MYDTFTNLTLKILNIYCNYFDKTYIYKPLITDKN